MSKRSCGIVFLGAGLFFVITGIVCGFLIPKIVLNAVDSITDSVGDAENEYLANENADIFSKIYYWEIKNKDDFMYNGKMAKLEERGPYVYKMKNQSTESATFLEEDSCSDCSEEDNITVLNIGYLQTMTKFENDTIFAVFHTPLTIKLLLQKQNYTQLGNRDESIWPDKSGWKNPGFGAWLHQVRPDLARRDFTEIEMKGLYDALGSHETLFGSTLDEAVRDNCTKNPIDKKCGLLWQMRAVHPGPSNLWRLLWMIRNTLCSNSRKSCFYNAAAGRMIPEYILHVSAYTMWYVLHEQDDVVTTMSQKKIALGYDMMKAQNPKTNKRIHVPGLVNMYLNADSVIKYIEDQTIYASEEKRDKTAALDGRNGTTSNSACKRSEEDGVDSGHMPIRLPHSKTADKPCSFSQELPVNSFNLSLMKTRLKMRLKEETSLYGLKLKRFTLQKTDFLQQCNVEDGLIDLFKLYKFPLVVSLPHFLYADNLTIPEAFHQSPDEKKHQSIYDVEPQTGIVARAELRFQFNLPIKKNSISARRIKALNISNITPEKEQLFQEGIPFAWIKQGGQIKKSDINAMKKKVIGVLALSCGLFITLPIIGCIFFFVFIVLFVLSFKSKTNEALQVTSPS